MKRPFHKFPLNPSKWNRTSCHRLLIPCLWTFGFCLPLSAQITQKVVLQEGDGTRQEAQIASTPITELFKPPVTKVVLAPNKLQWVKGNAGSTALVSPDDFVYEDGSPANGPVEFVMTEVTKKSEIMLGNLPTSSNGKMLETGGVVKLEAFCNGQPLKIAPGKSIALDFPDGKRMGMQLFEGKQSNDKGMDWVPILQGPSNLPFFSSGTEYIRIGGKGGPTHDFRYVYDDYKSLIAVTPFTDFGKVKVANLRFQSKSKAVDAYIVQQLQEYYPCIGSGVYELEIYFDANGHPVSIWTKGKPNRCIMLALHEIAARLEWVSDDNVQKASVSLEINIPGDPSSPNEFVSIGLNPNVTLDSATVKAFAKLLEIVEDREEQVRMANFTNSVMRTTSLNWINCDRFVTMQQVANATIAKDNSGIKSQSFLVFNELSSVLAGVDYPNGKISFGRVPRGMKAKVVTIGYDDQKGVFLGILPVMTENELSGKISLDPVSKETLQDRLADL